MRLNPSVIEIMFMCGQLAAGFGKPVYFQMLLFLFDTMSEKCVACWKYKSSCWWWTSL